jgi:hypothetical protein
MTAPTNFHPVILFEGDLKPIYYALLAAGRPDLAMIIEVKTGRIESELHFIAAAPSLDDNEFSYDTMPIVSESSEGAYVSCWVWVSRERIAAVTDEATEEALAEKRRVKLAAARRRRLCRRIERLKRKDRNASLMLLSETLYEVAPENWTGGIVKSKPEKRSKTCPRKTDVSSVPSSKPR